MYPTHSSLLAISFCAAFSSRPYLCGRYRNYVCSKYTDRLPPSRIPRPIPILRFTKLPLEIMYTSKASWYTFIFFRVCHYCGWTIILCGLLSLFSFGILLFRFFRDLALFRLGRDMTVQNPRRLWKLLWGWQCDGFSLFPSFFSCPRIVTSSELNGKFHQTIVKYFISG